MTCQVVSQLINGEEVLVNSKMCEDIEIDLNEIRVLSDSSKMRYVGLGKRGIYRLTLKSYKALKKEFMKRGSIWRFDYSHRA